MRTLQKGYVGAAFGSENIWQRWSRHAAVGGDARELKRYNPDDFIFSILQLVGQSTPKDEVEKLEASWKRRLHTREFGLNAPGRRKFFEVIKSGPEPTWPRKIQSGT